ncbi:unnamed protein product [Amaranthus hypochondriacus]
MVLVYHKITVKAENEEDEEDVSVQELRDKDGDQEKDEAQLIKAQIQFQKSDFGGKCEVQLTRFGEKIKNKIRKIKKINCRTRSGSGGMKPLYTTKKGSMKNNLKKKVRKKKNSGSNSIEAGVGENGGGSECGILGERENVSHVCSGSGGGPNGGAGAEKRQRGGGAVSPEFFVHFPVDLPATV